VCVGFRSLSQSLPGPIDRQDYERRAARRASRANTGATGTTRYVRPTTGSHDDGHRGNPATGTATKLPSYQDDNGRYVGDGRGGYFFAVWGKDDN
jgi:hypothetical protein